MFLNMEPHRDDFNLCIGIARLAAVLLVVLVATQAIGRLLQGFAIQFAIAIWWQAECICRWIGTYWIPACNDYARQGKLVVVQEVTEADYWSQPPKTLAQSSLKAM